MSEKEFVCLCMTMFPSIAVHLADEDDDAAIRKLLENLKQEELLAMLAAVSMEKRLAILKLYETHAKGKRN